MMSKTQKKQQKRKGIKTIGIPKRTDVKVGSTIGDFWNKLKGLYPS